MDGRSPASGWLAGVEASDRRSWNDRHRTAAPGHAVPPTGLDDAPVCVPTSGRALDVACGRGGVTVWAAERGLDVIALDASPEAVGATRSLATAAGVGHRVDARVHDLDGGLPGGIGSFDLIVCQRYRDPELWPALVRALRPGGTLVVTVLSVVGATVEGRFRADAGELEAAFGTLGVDVVRAAEGDGVATVVAVLPERGPLDSVPPMDDNLRSVLEELKATIVRSEADGVIDDDEREELRALSDKLDALLGETEDNDGLVDQLEESAIRFEGNHPTVAAVIRSAIDTLTGYGM